MIRRKRHGKSRELSRNRSGRPTFYKIACAGCGKEVAVQVCPPERQETPVYGMFQKTGACSMIRGTHSPDLRERGKPIVSLPTHFWVM